MMKFSTILTSTVAIAIFGSNILPAPLKALEYQNNFQSQSSQQIVIPASTSIAAVTASNILVELDDADNHAIALVVMQSLQTRDGRVIVPEGSIINARLHEQSDGVVIAADSLIAHGQTIPIQANSAMIPSTMERRSGSTERGILASTVGGAIGGDIAQAAGADISETTRASSGASAFGFLVGAITGNRREEMISIPQGQIQVLTLQSSITIPSSASRTN